MMKAVTALAIGFRIMGLWLVVVGFLAIPRAVSVMQAYMHMYRPNGQIFWVTIFEVFAQLVIGGAIILYSVPIAKFLARDLEDPAELGYTYHLALPVGLILMGVFCLTEYLPLILILDSPDNIQQMVTGLPAKSPNIHGIVGTLIGLICILVGYWHFRVPIKVHYATQENPPQT